MNATRIAAPSSAPRSVRVQGLEFAALTEREAAEAVVAAAVGGHGVWTITANLDHLRRFRREPGARALLDGADLIVADGSPIVWASRLAGTPLPERVAGSSMVWGIAAAAARAGASLFLLGGNPGTAVQAAERLAERAPGLRIAGTLCPEFGFEHDDRRLAEIEAAVCAAAPDVVLVGLGFPKQDQLIERLRPLLPAASFVGVGISFSFIAGEVSRAPDVVQKMGLEWAHRLVQEPRRLARRYLVDGLPFALLLLAESLRRRLIT